VPPKEGMDLYLTIDETIQYIVERELDRAMLEYRPKRAMAMAADPARGDPGGRLPAGFRSPPLRGIRPGLLAFAAGDQLF